MSNMTISGAKHVIDIAGLPEMAIQNLHLSDIIGSGQIGMTAEYADGLELHNVQINTASGPAFHAAHSTNLELDHVTTRKPLSGEPVVRLDETPGAILRDSRAFPGTSVFLSVAPGALKQVVLVGNVLGNAATPTQEGPGELQKPEQTIGPVD